MNKLYDVIIIGAGAAGLMCAQVAGQRKKSVLLLEHSQNVGEKIRISGGGRCNFTNIHTSPKHFLSQNPHFCKSALSRYTPQDFIALAEKHSIAYHEKKLGQLFCDHSAKDIIEMLLDECAKARVKLKKGVEVTDVACIDDAYHITAANGVYQAPNLVVATGGLSIPKIGATKFGYEIAKQFGLEIVPTRAGLVPLTFQNQLLEMCKSLSGLSADARVYSAKTSFAEGLLFTHRGLSGPSILQISSYWQEGTEIEVDLCPGFDVAQFLTAQKQTAPKQDVNTALSQHLPKRLVDALLQSEGISGRLADLSKVKIAHISQLIHRWRIKPNGTEGYRTAEVTLGGVDTKHLSSKTMECNTQKGLYFIGEVVDVTGHLGGYNFQWAWASAHAAGQAIN